VRIPCEAVIYAMHSSGKNSLAVGAVALYISMKETSFSSKLEEGFSL